MVVDNEVGVCDIYRNILQKEGFDVETFLDGESAMERIDHQHFDIVITDLKMPKVDGYHVIRKIKEVSPRTEIIVISGYATLDSVVQTIKMGVNDYLVKPFEVVDLVAKVKKCVQTRGSC